MMTCVFFVLFKIIMASIANKKKDIRLHVSVCTPLIIIIH